MNIFTDKELNFLENLKLNRKMQKISNKLEEKICQYIKNAYSNQNELNKIVGDSIFYIENYSIIHETIWNVDATANLFIWELREIILNEDEFEDNIPYIKLDSNMEPLWDSKTQLSDDFFRKIANEAVIPYKDFSLLTFLLFERMFSTEDIEQEVYNFLLKNNYIPLEKDTYFYIKRYIKNYPTGISSNLTIWETITNKYGRNN